MHEVNFEDNSGVVVGVDVDVVAVLVGGGVVVVVAGGVAVMLAVVVDGGKTDDISRASVTS
jgi:hypothetical protein